MKKAIKLPEGYGLGAKAYAKVRAKNIRRRKAAKALRKSL